MDSKKKQQRVGFLIILIAFVSLIVFQLYGDDLIKKRMKLEVSHVTSVYLYDKYARQRICYAIGNDTMLEDRDDIKYWILQKLQGKYIPVVYDSVNKKYSRILTQLARMFLRIYGKGNFIDMGARHLETRIWRTLKSDVKSAKYPMLSSYSHAANNPIVITGPDGRDIHVFGGKQYEYVEDLKLNTTLLVQFNSQTNKLELNGVPRTQIDFPLLKRAMMKLLMFECLLRMQMQILVRDIFELKTCLPYSAE